MMLCRISHGDLVTVARNNVFVVLRPLPGTPLFDKDMGVHLWHALGSERGIHRAIAHLAQNGLEAMPEFVMVKRQKNTLDVIVRGEFRALLLNHDGKYASVGSEGVATWREHTNLLASEFCVRAEPGMTIQGEDAFYLASGVSSISVVCSLGWDDPDQPVNAVELAETGAIPEVELYADADAHSLSQAVAQRLRETRRAPSAGSPSMVRGSGSPRSASPISGAAPVVSPEPIAAAAPVTAVEPVVNTPVVSPAPLLARSVPLSEQPTEFLPPYSQYAEQEEDRAAQGLTPTSALPPTHAVPSTHAVPAVGQGSAFAHQPDQRQQLQQPVSHPTAQLTPQFDEDNSSTVLTNNVVQYRAAMETERNLPLPPEPIVASVPTPVPAIRLSNGVRIPLDRTVRLGRAPEASRFPMRDLPRLVTVPSPTNDVSRTHAQVRVEGEFVLVTDLNSTNGVFLVEPGSTPRRLHPDEPTQLTTQVVVDLGDGVTFTLEDNS